MNTKRYLFMSELEVGRDKMTDRVSETCSTFSRLEATLPLTDNRQFSFMSKCIYVFGHKWSNPLQKGRKHNQLGNTQPDNYQFTFPITGGW